MVGCPRNRERAAISEIRYFIQDLLEDEELKISRTPISGLIACSTGLDPFEIIQRLREFAIENPYQFRFAIKFTPLEKCVPSELGDIVDAVEEIKSKIQQDDTFRISVRRRHTEMDHMEIVKETAHVIDRKVNLDNPDWTVWIDVVGEWTGVSVLDKKNDILSIMTMRDDMY